MSRAYDEIVEFIARGSTPDAVADFEPSQDTKDYVADPDSQGTDGRIDC